MADAISLWEVVGGASRGGLIVRTGRETRSPELPERLATGALVRALEKDEVAERIFYKKVSGAGPALGWVSTSLKGKGLLAKCTRDLLPEEEEAKDVVNGPEVVMELYCRRFGKADEDDLGVFPRNRRAFSWKAEGCAGALLPEEEVRAELERGLSLAGPFSRANAHIAVDSRLLLCSHCHLPVGNKAYATKRGEQTVLHGECLAQLMLKDLKEQGQALEQKEAATKRQRREEFDIGWRVEHIPRCADTAVRLPNCSVREGMCCLVLQEDNSLRVVSTVEPAASVCLEYLSIALQVRRQDNREPLFSLDPTDTTSPKDSMQVKRFEPGWLAGTSVGEVLFQADYHLKELSMGEYEQPITGMKSCHDFSDCDEQDKWSAREWFVVRKAEVQLTDDNVLIPCVKLGVEAREQVLGEQGLEDVRTTRPNHPLVKYAEAFTHNFDLIAERKSVVFHLRELAKASVLAKFLVEADVSLDESWFKAYGEAEEACCLEIPQLWNERSHSQIRVQDGTIVNADAGFGTSLRRLYGGVQFGLDKFQLAGARQPARMLSAGLAARQFVQPARHLSSTLSAGLATRQFQRSFGPVGVQPARVAAGVGLDKFALAGARQPARMLSAGLAARQFVQPARHLSATLSAGLATRQFQRSFGPVGVSPARVSGVDLNLDEFNLSEVAPATREGAVSLSGLDAGVDVNAAFWSSISDESASIFSNEDKSLLRSIFNPSLSDRREEGARFVPPDTSSAYVQSLRSLVREEEATRRQRKQHFCSTAFVSDSPGIQFSTSWRSSVEIKHEEAGQASSRLLHPRLDYKAQAQVFEQALTKAVPVFDKSTEDGTRFRIYKIGSLEVRTTQDIDGKELVGAVFSLSASTDAAKQQKSVNLEERVVKATEYVEASGKDYHCYVVLETESKNVVVTEELKNGTLRHEANPKDLEDRNSLAKVLRSTECANTQFTVGGLKALQRDVYKQVSGSHAGSGFRMK